MNVGKGHQNHSEWILQKLHLPKFTYKVHSKNLQTPLAVVWYIFHSRTLALSQVPTLNHHPLGCQSLATFFWWLITLIKATVSNLTIFTLFWIHAKVDKEPKKIQRDFGLGDKMRKKFVNWKIINLPVDNGGLGGGEHIPKESVSLFPQKIWKRFGRNCGEKMEVCLS